MDAKVELHQEFAWREVFEKKRTYKSTHKNNPIAAML